MYATKRRDLTPKQEAAITALLTEHTIERAAKTAGVATQTLYNWLDQPAFSRAFRRARRQAFGQAISTCRFVQFCATERDAVSSIWHHFTEGLNR